MNKLETILYMPCWLWVLLYLIVGCVFYCATESMTNEKGTKFNEAINDVGIYIMLSLGGLTLLWPLGIINHIKGEK